MKAIISHDIDLITAWEHKIDLAIPKLIARSSLELAIGSISCSEYFSRFKELAENQLHNLDELIKFDQQNKVPSTFFIGVTKGGGLSYSLSDAKYWTNQILNRGFDVGVHGVKYNNLYGIQYEYETFKKFSGLTTFGIRMHYLRNSINTLSLLSEAGYLFDSTLARNAGPFKTNTLWEFPLHIMDTYLFEHNSRWQNQTLEQAKTKTEAKIEEINNSGIKYLTILFHDRYFSDSFKSFKDWYIWTVDYLKGNKVEFTTYARAVKQLERNI